MGYRGDDLDLRTPQTWSATAADLGGEGGPRGRQTFSSAQRGGPIWVDETVLAACNHAFDVALAHRSMEVRVEHLLHALTRIDAAAEELEVRGIRVTALRRETATLIASELPAGLPNGKSTPRRSEDFEEVLRLAAVQASRRDAPAGVDDLLRAIQDVRPDLPLAAGTQRYAPRYSNAYLDTAPVARSPYAPEPERQRSYAPLTEPPRVARPEPAGRGDFGHAPIDSIQNSRLEALEQMVRALSNDLQNERKVFTGVLQDLQRDVMAQRDDSMRFTGGSGSDIADRLTGLERAVASLRTAAVDLSPVLDRLAALERTLLARSASNVDLSPVTQRLDIIEEAVLQADGQVVSDLIERMKALEEQATAERTRATQAQADLKAMIERQRSEIAVAVLTPLVQRLDALTGAVDERNSDTTAKLASLEAAFGSSSEKAADAQAAHAQELAEVHDALMKLNTNQHTLAGSIEQWRRDDAGQVTVLMDKVQGLATSTDGLKLNIGGFGTRLEGVEKEVAKPVQMLTALSGTVDKMHKVTVERYYRRNRFWYWLFGTDDWVAASWPSQAARITEDLTMVKNAVRK